MKVKKILLSSKQMQEKNDKIQHDFMIKNSQQNRNLRTYFNIVKGLIIKPHCSFLLNGENLKAFLLRTGIRQRCSCSPLSIHLTLEVQVRVIRKCKETMSFQFTREVILSLHNTSSRM